MRLLKILIEMADVSMEQPKPYEKFHIFCFVTVGIISLLCLLLMNCRDSTFRAVIMLFWLSMAIMELIKTVTVTHTIVDEQVIFKYNWVDFPFQLCSTPIYVLPFLAVLPDSAFRDVFASYTIAFAFIGGIGTFLFPETVLGTTWFGNIHTMNHHGIQIITGIFVTAWYRKRLNLKFYLKGAFLFVLMFLIAMWLNTDFYEYLMLSNEHIGFNMFYINPNEPYRLKFLAEIVNKLPIHLLHVYYFASVILLSLLIMIIFRSGFGSVRLNDPRSKREEAEKVPM